MKAKEKNWVRGIWVVFLIIFGVIFELLNLGADFLLSWSLGQWLIYVGIIGLFVWVLQSFRRKERVVDERMILIGHKANRIVFLSLLIGAFVVMVVDGLVRIELSYRMFMSYLICFILLVYFISYKIIEKRN